LRPDVNGELTHQKLFRWYEIAGFVLIVCAVLYLLFPKDKIVNLVKKEKSNDTLIIKYIENIKRYYNTDLDMNLMLFDKYIATGSLDRAKEQFEYIKKRFPSYEEIPFLRYKMLKIAYFKSYDEDEKNRIRQKIAAALREILNASRKNETYKRVYQEALSFGLYPLAKEAIRRVALSTLSPVWLEKAYDLAIQTSDTKEAIEYLKLLLKEDRNNKNLYMLKLAKLYIADQQYASASRIFEELSEGDPVNRTAWLEESAKYALAAKEYEKASKLYLKAMKSVSQEKKSRYFVEAIKSLLWGNKPETAAKMAREYKNDFISDKESAYWMLKAALAAGDLKLANEISKSLAKRL